MFYFHNAAKERLFKIMFGNRIDNEAFFQKVSLKTVLLLGSFLYSSLSHKKFRVSVKVIN